MRRTLLAAVAICALLALVSAAFAKDVNVVISPSHTPSHLAGHQGLIVIGHRGASGYRPEHTLESYRLAIHQGADFIEPDLVATKDGVLVTRHENEISGTTDVADHPEFANRRTTKRIDGHTTTGWFTEDFTLAELKTLRAKERIPAIRPGNTKYDGLYPVPTLAEVVRLAKAESRDGRVIGVYPETKHPTYFAREGRHLDGSQIGISLGAKLIETLVAEGFTDPRRVYIQSFEVENLIALKKSIMPSAGVEFPLVQLFGDIHSSAPYDFKWNLAQGNDLNAIYGGLIGTLEGGITRATRYSALATEPALQWMKANYASGLGPSKANLLPRAHPMLAYALKAGMVVHPYTLRAEAQYLTQTPTGAHQSVVAEAVQLYGLGVQGFFIDQPDLGVAARDIFLNIDKP